MRTTRTTLLVKFSTILAMSMGSACSSTPPPEPRGPTPSAPDVPVQAPVAQQPREETAVSISKDIRAACGLSDTEAYFAYNSARVRQSDHVLLKKLGDCFMIGPLQGRGMRLVGHADPRGDEEYNYVLGQSRADSVKSAIVSVGGLEAGRIATTSRGEDEARGADEAGWTRDRRVEVVLAE